MELLTRAGFAARGLLYILIGWLALREGREEDPASALSYLEAGGGTVPVFIAALALLAYGLWRIANAWSDGDHHGAGGKGRAVRVGGAVSGLIHIGLGLFALRLAWSGRDAGDGSGGARDGTESALALPGGWMLVVLGALVLLVVGLFQLVHAAKAGFLKTLAPEAAQRPAVRLIGQAGYAARALIFLLMAWFLFQAGRRADAREAGGLGEALGSLPPQIEWIVAAGLMLFGLFSLVEARYRRIATPAMPHLA